MSRSLLFLAVAMSCGACASILDFQEPTDKVAASSVGDAGLLATNAVPAASTSYLAPLDASTVDAAEETPVVHGPPVVASGWQGPFVIARTTDGSTPAACDGAYPSEAYLGFAGSNAPAANCGCSCGDPTDVACSTPQTAFFGDAACTGSCGAPVTTSLSCAAVSPYSCDLLGLTKPKSMSVTASVASGGACLPLPKVNVAPATWSSAVRLCGSPTATSTPSPSFSATNRCVTKAGDNACPAAYPAKQLFHQSGTDTRACTACTCGTPANVACIADISTFNGASCTTATAALPADCTAVSNATRISVDSATARGGSCGATGGAPTGAFTEDAPTTVCCFE